MSKIDSNPILKGASGMLGDTIFYRTVNGQIQMANKPKKRKSFSPDQEAIQIKFQLARDYAKKQSDNEEFKKLYATGITKKKTSAYAVAMSDYLNAPIVHAIGTLNYAGNVGDVVEVIALDDFKVTSVKVVITAADGSIIEKGEAEGHDVNATWVYKATVANPLVAGTTIKATAFDRPGNYTSLEKVLA